MSQAKRLLELQTSLTEQAHGRTILERAVALQKANEDAGKRIAMCNERLDHYAREADRLREEVAINDFLQAPLWEALEGRLVRPASYCTECPFVKADREGVHPTCSLPGSPYYGDYVGGKAGCRLRVNLGQVEAWPEDDPKPEEGGQ
jgi:hypothetical protein